MKIGVTNNLIPQNIAPSNARKLAIFNNAGQEILSVGLGNLSPKSMGEKLYSFGALSDIHLQYSTAQADFVRALEYLNDTEDVAFACICGDLTQTGTATNLAVYKNHIDTYSPNTPVYEIAGNHESYTASWGQNGEETVRSLMKTYTDKPLYYSLGISANGKCVKKDVNETPIAYGDDVTDVFIMVGICADGAKFGTGGLQWLYETLEANRNKRCIVFQHIRPDDACGNAYGIYHNDIWNGTQAVVFENLMKHYKNVIFFHGHSHLRFGLQTRNNLANIDEKYGRYSVHIPSLVAPKTGNIDGTGETPLYDESEGYVVDVYANHIVLRGRDFVKGEFIPIATYCLDTTLQNIEANTFTDSTGTITT